MTASFELPPEDGHVDAAKAEQINHAMDQAEARELAITAYIARVDTMPGQLGDLLRTIGEAHRAYIDAEHDNATTIGEYSRLSTVVDEALTTLDWLLEGERPDPEVTE